MVPDAADGAVADAARDVIETTDASGPITATAGFCPVKDRIGLIRLLGHNNSFGQDGEGMSLRGMIYDKVPPFLGPAAVKDDPCEHFAPSFCPELCDKDQECDYSGICRDPARALTHVVVTVSSTAGVETFEPHPTTRQLGGPVTDAGDDASYELRVSIDGERPILFSAKMPARFAGGVAMADEGWNSTSGRTTTTWTSAGNSALIRLYFHPNHHAGVGFTQCITSDDTEKVVASAAVMDPLRPTTGLENIDAERTFVGFAQLDRGCVELAMSIMDVPERVAP